MTTHGGAREGAGRPPRQEPKARPIWCGQMSEEHRALILETLSPAERFDTLMAAVEMKGEMEMKAYGKQMYVCGKCGRTADEQHVRGWLIASSNDGEDQANGVMVIRCPAHITNYAIRKAQGGRVAIR